jgi:hypothetical protein
MIERPSLLKCYPFWISWMAALCAIPNILKKSTAEVRIAGSKSGRNWFNSPLRYQALDCCLRSTWPLSSSQLSSALTLVWARATQESAAP